jgi:hypothetical protein
MARLAREALKSDRFVNFWEGRFWPDGAPTLDEIDDAIRPVYIYRDEYEETVRTPEYMVNDLQTLGHLEGDCDDISTQIAAVCLLFGYRVRFVAIRYDPAIDYIQHVFVQALDDSGWRVIDLTVPIGTQMLAIEEMFQDI